MAVYGQLLKTAWIYTASGAIFALVQLQPSAFSRPPNLRLIGLDANQNYRVRAVYPAGPPTSMQIKPPKWLDGVVINGALLAAVGLKAPILQPQQALLIEAERI